MFTFDKVLDEIMDLDFSSREMLLEILRKRQIEERRKEIARNARKAQSDFSSGKYKPLTASEAIKQLAAAK